MTKKSSKKKWIKGHLKDKYVKLATKEKLKSRASFKLRQINDRYKIIKEDDAVIDMGAAPGGWSQIASGIVKEKGLVISVDLLPVIGIPGVKVVLGDVFSEDILSKIEDILQESGIKKVDAIISDMAPNITGISSTDAARSFELNKRALFYAEKYLKKGGNLIVKLFRNEYFDEYLKEVKSMFSSCSIYKPEASRSKSSEIYLVAKTKK